MPKKFQNPPSSLKSEKFNLIKWLRFFARQLRGHTDLLPTHYIIPQAQALADLQRLQAHNTLTWLGHNTFILRLAGKTILTDPFLSNYASPIQGLGPKRCVPPGMSIENLPPIDIVVVTHDHYDHLDLITLSKLKNKSSIQVIVPLQMSEFFYKLGYTKITELDWYQHYNDENIKITLLPSIHYSKRSLFTRNTRLWGSFSFEGDGLRIYHSSDTAYSNLFKDIGRQYGPFDYAMVDIGAYEPNELLRYVHINPEEAAQIGKDIGAKNLIAMHWGTVVLSDEPLLEPPERFVKAGLSQGYASDQLWVLKIGETRPLKY